ncbi:hypothetical protein AAFF_G00160910 [Aldrovandia affinis]|uniref:Uncharacterized protein n=1 Tax=Aldrovandia affinis TaxID=143900 RepID=A0AAD7VX72_9TELE|nr:hypothetical protein AAFF_G00160910 [Aldrovandia affinis]
MSTEGRLVYGSATKKTKAMIIGQDQHHQPLSLGEHDNMEKEGFNKNWQSCRSVPTARNIWSSNAITTAIKLRLHVSGHSNSDPRQADGDEDSQHHQHVGCLPPTMPQNHLEDLMEKKTGWTRTRLPRERPASVAMDWVPEGGKRKRGRPKKTWRHTFKEDLREMGVSWHGAWRVASDRCRWRGLVAQCSSRNGRN